MKLATEVGLGPGDIVLDGNSAAIPQKGHSPPNFRPMSIVAKRLDGSRCHLVRRKASAQVTFCEMGTQFSPKGAQLSNFRPMSIVVKRSPISSTAEHLLNDNFRRYKHRNRDSQCLKHYFLSSVKCFVIISVVRVLDSVWLSYSVYSQAKD